MPTGHPSMGIYFIQPGTLDSDEPLVEAAHMFLRSSAAWHKRKEGLAEFQGIRPSARACRWLIALLATILSSRFSLPRQFLNSGYAAVRFVAVVEMLKTSTTTATRSSTCRSRSERVPKTHGRILHSSTGKLVHFLGTSEANCFFPLKYRPHSQSIGRWFDSGRPTSLRSPPASFGSISQRASARNDHEILRERGVARAFDSGRSWC